LAIKANVAVIATLRSQIEVLEKRLQERVKPRPQYKLLTSVPGIGQTLATVIPLETGPIDRFADVGNFASYARCVDSVHTSNRKKKGERQERQQISGLGIRRRGELRQALLPRGQVFPRAQEGQDQQHRRHQGAGAQAGARQLSHLRAGQAVRRNALLRLRDDGDPASHLR
jgi:hypothetical protein